MRKSNEEQRRNVSTSVCLQFFIVCVSTLPDGEIGMLLRSPSQTLVL